MTDSINNNQLQTENSRLEAMVQELQREIAFYKSESKRLTWEKDILNQDIKRMSSLFKSWVGELQSNPVSRNISEETAQFNAMVNYPCKSISEVLQLSNNLVVMTSSQQPHFIEYVNKGWCQQTGWNNEEILGYTCAFLQGPLTDKKVTEAFMKDLKEVGYARMRVINYKKNGEAYEVTVTVFPVFDSVSASGTDAEVAVLTHFATILREIKPVSISLSHRGHNSSNPRSDTTSSLDESTSERSSGEGNGSRGTGSGDGERSFSSPSNSNSHSNSQSNSNNNSSKSGGEGPNSHTITGNSHTTSNSGVTSNSASKSEENSPHHDNKANVELKKEAKTESARIANEIMEETAMIIQQGNDEVNSNQGSGTDSVPQNERQSGSDPVTPPSESSEEGFYDRRRQAQKFEPKCVISQESFFNFGRTLRLSNLLRLMLSCNNAMVLTNSHGQIIHINSAWTHLTGYDQPEVEGRTCKFLQGPETDLSQTQHLMSEIHQNKACSIMVMNYKKNGEKFLNKLIVVPLRGNYLNEEISHYCGLCIPQIIDPHQNIAKDTPIGGMEIVLSDSTVNANLYPGSANSDVSSSSHSSNSQVQRLSTQSHIDLKAGIINPLDLSRSGVRDLHYDPHYPSDFHHPTRKRPAQVEDDDTPSNSRSTSSSQSDMTESNSADDEQEEEDEDNENEGKGNNHHQHHNGDNNTGKNEGKGDDSNGNGQFHKKMRID